jgi:hypothetical protein
LGEVPGSFNFVADTGLASDVKARLAGTYGDLLGGLDGVDADIQRWNDRSLGQIEQMGGGASYLDSAIIGTLGGIGRAGIGTARSAASPLTSFARSFESLVQANATPVRTLARQFGELSPQRQIGGVSSAVAPTIASIVVSKSFSGSAVEIGPNTRWLAQARAGRAFDLSRKGVHDFDQIYLNSPSGKGYTILDSYNLSRGEIISRKFTQFSVIDSKSAFGYIDEIGRKYAPGSTIANVPSTREAGLAGQKLSGLKFLEIPVQTQPIPRPVIERANATKVILRDIDGRIYR